MLTSSPEEQGQADRNPPDTTNYAKALFNILQDFGKERIRMVETQRAMLNILQDFGKERTRMGETQRAMLNILQDFGEENKKVEQANVSLDSVNRELKDLNEAMRDFVATAAHDLRTPIAAVLGFATTLTQRWDSTADPQKRQFVEVIERQGQVLSTLVDDLLILSRLEAGALPGQPEIFKVKEVIEEACGYYTEELATIVIGVPDRLLVIADREHVRRIFTNLVSNALKYGASPISVQAAESDTFVEIRVLDSGDGVPQEFVPRLFSRFARADTSQTREVKGSGLGLSIVEGLVRASGGEVWYELDPTGGACFAVRLPKPA